MLCWPEPQLSASAWGLVALTTPSKTISLDVQNAEVCDVLRLLAETGGVNILTSGEVQGTIMTSAECPWEQALAAILRITGLTQERTGASTGPQWQTQGRSL